MHHRAKFLSLFLAFPLAAKAEVVINEIMYHPASENPAEEYLELYNTGPAAVNVSGWQFTSGVSFTVPPATSIPAGGYLVVTANPGAFHTKYPAVANYIPSASWTGLLSNSANHLILKNAAGVKMDEVDYAADGDWGSRVRDNPPSFGHRGWGWTSAADGGGKSLELVNAAFDNSEGQNWLPSATANGTPGTANSVASANIAPVITEVAHFPLVPASTDTVTVTARVRDELTAGLTVTLQYRDDGAAAFTAAPMFDDGTHSDALAGDGIYGTQLPARPNGTVIEFYVQAADAASNTRSWPAQAVDYTGTPGHFCNCLYQVDDTLYSGTQPVYYLVLKAADKTELGNINTNTGAPPFPFNAGEANDQTLSHARLNGTFISRDGTGLKLQYLAGTRNRGESVRSAQPQSLNVQFTADDPWNGVRGLNLNSQHTPFQLFGSALLRKAGLTVAESRAVQVRVNATNGAGPGNPAYGFYACNEVEDSVFAGHHYPADPSGNLYRGARNDGAFGADLRDQSAGQPAATASPTPYRVNYVKETNTSADKWADLIGLTKTLAKGHAAAGYTATYDADFASAVQAGLDVPEWMTYFAANVIVDNDQPSLVNGEGDDYYLYFGVSDAHAQVIPFDLDTLFHPAAGTTTPGDPTAHGLFRMCRSTESGNPPTPLFPLMAHTQFARLYLKEIVRLLDGPFSAAQFNPLADEMLGPVWDNASIQAVKNFNTARAAYIRTLLPLSFSVTSAQTTGGTPLTVTSGYPRSTAAACKLVGKANCLETASVKVNGAAATYTPWQVTNVASFTTSAGDWSADNVALTPGINRLHIQAFDENSQEIEQSYFDVWYDDGSVASVSGAIAANTTWTAAGGPYQVTANLTVNSGVTLTIQSGTTVYLNSGITITAAAGGRILAEGTDAQPIRFTRLPGGTGNGGTITIDGQAGAPETHFYYTFFEFGGNPAVTCHANSNVVIDHCEWLRNDVAYLHLDGGSFIVSNCIFPASASNASFEGVHGSNAAPPVGGRAIIRDCYFGKINSSAGSSDIVDFTGGNRPNPIIQFYNNVFAGTDDDVLDLDGTDAWVEGNIFMHIHRNGSPDSSSAISGGNDAGGNGLGSSHDVSAIDTATDILTCGTHGYTTGQEVAVSKLLGNTFPAATPAIHDGGPYYVGVLSTTTVKLYLTSADAIAGTNAINFTGSIATGVTMNLQKLDGVSHITMVGNIFYDLDQAATGKQSNFYTFLNNTVIKQDSTGSQDPVTDVLNVADDGYREASGMYAEGNIIQNAMGLMRNYSASFAQTVVWNNNLFPPGMTWPGTGSGNTSGDAKFNDPVNIPTPGPYDYKRVAAQIRQKLGLQAASSAKGTGPNWADKGGVRPIGVSIGGAPSGTTNLTGATLTVGTRMTGNGIQAGSGIPAGAAGGGAWANGSGWTHYKWRLDGGAWSAETVISTPITVAGLANGTHTVDVTGKNDAGTYQDDPALGTTGRLSSATWTVDTGSVPPVPGVRLNEVLAKNAATQGFGGVFPDIIELYNAGTSAAVLDGWGLTDDAALPYKYTFPASTTLAPGAFLVVYASSSASVPSPKTGFALAESGATLTLTKSAAAGGAVADTVSFGVQLADFSIGRSADGQWNLSIPTFGAVNTAAAAQSPVSAVRINEWLADAQVLAGQDFVELFNPAALPVNIGGSYLTDNPQGWPGRFQIRPLTFLSANSYVAFKADGDTSEGLDHLNFKLAPEQGEIGLFDSTLAAVDTVIYGPQSTDVSQGRTPNGGDSISFFTQPTPGAPNPQASTVTGTTQSVDVILPAQAWKYMQSAADPFGGATTWKDTSFNDGAWPSGGGVLYIENSAIPANTDGFAKTTLLTGFNTTHPYQTYYFRTHFNYTGTLNNVTFTAKVIVDDAAILYLNGQEITPVSGNRIRLPAGADTFALQAPATGPDVTIETYTFNTNGLVIGDNVLAVSVHQSDTQSATAGSSDITWGLKLTANYTIPSAGADNIVINEVLPVNTAQQNPDGSFAGWIELYNTGATAGDLAGVSVTNEVGSSRAFVFPAGTTVPAGGYMLLYCNGQAPATAAAPFNSGFSLNGAGSGVFVFKAPASGGGLLASVNYGSQIPDFSIGRVPNGTGPFALNTVTKGASNAAAATVTAASVKINEWLTDGAPGWLELYNTSATPAAIGGNFLTDQLTDRSKSLIPPLSFLAGSGTGRWLQLIADNDSVGTPGHVNFSLESGEGIALYTPSGTLLESVVTTAHSAGTTQGRFPDGTAAISFLNPTPGAANALTSGGGGDGDNDGLPDAWESANGLNPNDPADALLDGDHDGVSNLIEYAFNMDPRASDAKALTPGGNSGMPVAQLVTVPGGKALEITFLRRKSPGGDSLNVTAQFSGDLTTWSGGLTPTVVSIDAAFDRVTVRDSSPVTSARRFARVSVAAVP